MVSPILIFGDVKETARFVGDAGGKKTPSPQGEDLTGCLKLLSSQLLAQRFLMLAILSKIKSEKPSSRLCSLEDSSGYEVRVEQLRRSDPGT